MIVYTHEAISAQTISTFSEGNPQQSILIGLCVENVKQIVVVKIVSFLAIVVRRNKLQNAAFQNTMSSLTFENFQAKLSHQIYANHALFKLLAGE